MIYLILVAMILNLAYLTINIILNNNNIFDGGGSSTPHDDDDDFFYSYQKNHKYKEDCYPLYFKEYPSDF
jgi:hypothetical protein